MLVSIWLVLFTGHTAVADCIWSPITSWCWSGCTPLPVEVTGRFEFFQSSVILNFHWTPHLFDSIISSFNSLSLVKSSAAELMMNDFFPNKIGIDKCSHTLQYPMKVGSDML